MGLLRIRIFAASTVMLACCAAPAARGAEAYLTQIGPPPLRFSLATAHFSFTLPSALVERTAPTNAEEITMAKTNSVDKPAETNVVAVQQTPAPASTTTNSIAPVQPNPVGQPNPVNSASANDLLVVSPQMLTEFFKPGSDATNSANTPVVMPAPVGFTPPSAVPSSQAIYRSP